MKKVIFALFLSICLAVPLLTSTAAGAACTPTVVSRDDIDSMALRVDGLSARVESTSPAGTVDEQRRLYLSLDKEVDALEDEIDLLEDRYELEYLTGSLSWEDYKSLERELDELDNKLDRAEDYLKRAFHGAR